MLCIDGCRLLYRPRSDASLLPTLFISGDSLYIFTTEYDTHFIYLLPTKTDIHD